MSRPAPQIPVPRERDANYVYLIATEDFEFVKIGRARDAHARLKRLQTGNHLDLMIIAEILCEDEAEQQFHSRIKYERVRGEWFKCTDEKVVGPSPTQVTLFMEIISNPPIHNWYCYQGWPMA